jgi:Tol biopolymer transport system component
MIMKRILMLGTVVLLLALGAGTTLAQSGYDLFQKALVKERAIGDVEEALRLYQRVVKEFAGNHALAAKAELRMGLLYDRLGRKPDAQRAYQAVVSQYADQTNEARQARAKIVVAAAPRNINASAKAATGLTVRQVWADAGGPSAISSDGRHLAYRGNGGALCVRDLQTGENRRLTPVIAQWDMQQVWWAPVFSPDGKLLAYGRNDSGLHADLRLITLDGSAPRVLYSSDEGVQLRPFDWSTDGKHILGVTRQSGIFQIVLVSVADGSVRVLKKLDWGFPLNVSLSRDGRYVVYDWQARKDAPERDIFILGTDGGHEAHLVTRAADDSYPVWTPDGRGVIFLSRRAANGPASLTAISVWFLRVVDGTPQGSPELRRSDLGATNPVPIGFTQNGSFYYSLQSGKDELYVATLDPESGTVAAQPATVTQRSVAGTRAVWSPNGQYLAYEWHPPSVQGEVPARLIVIRSDATGQEYELAPDLSTFKMFSWSPDSRFLLARGADKEKRNGLFRVDARTADVVPLLYAKPGEVFGEPRWFPNDKSIVFIGKDSVGQHLVLRNLETGQETELYRPPASILFDNELEVSGDGQRLAFDLRDPAAGTMWLMVMMSPGEKPRELGPRVKFPEVIDMIWALTPGGGHVLFTTVERGGDDKTYKVWRIAAEGGGPQQIQLPMADLGDADMASFHPDGRRIAFISFQRKKEVWVMDNFLPMTQTKKTTASRR